MKNTEQPHEPAVKKLELESYRDNEERDVQAIYIRDFSEEFIKKNLPSN